MTAEKPVVEVHFLLYKWFYWADCFQKTILATTMRILWKSVQNIDLYRAFLYINYKKYNMYL